MVSVTEAFSIALSFHEANDLENAESVYRQILHVDPTNSSSLNNLMVIIGYEAMIPLYEAATAFNPSYLEGHMRLGNIYRWMERPDDAIICFDRVVRLDPSNFEAIYNIAFLLQAGGYLDEALYYCKWLLLINPQHADSLNSLASSFQKCGRIDETIVCLELLRQNHPDNQDVHLRLFVHYLSKGRIDEAASSLERLVELQPDSINVHQRLISLYQEHERYEEMERACRRIISAGPASLYFFALTTLGFYLEGQEHRHDDAIALYDGAISLVPGHAFADTRRRLLLIRRSWGQPPAAVKRQPGPYITMSGLGNNGRFGNQVIQYAFLRVYAHVHGLAWETSYWIGRDVFGLDDPYISEKLPTIQQKDMDYSSVAGLSPDLVANKDISGYYFFSARAYAPHKAFYQSVFTFSQKARHVVEPVLEQLRQQGNTVVAIHVRRGDLCSGPFWVVPEDFYLEWLNELWPTLEKPLLFIATDAPEIATAFAAFSPLTGADFALPPPGVEFLVDYAVLIDADILATANSSFSYTAALLNKRCRLFVQPCPTQRKMVAYDPWDDASDGSL